MSEEQLGAGQPLIEHLIELRRRLLWAASVFVLCLLALLPFAKQIYALVAQPLMAALPQGTHMIATDVAAPFFVPLKVTAMAAGAAAAAVEPDAVCRRHGVLLLSGVSGGV